MAHRIEIASTIPDTRASVRKQHIESSGFAGKVDEVNLVDVYTIDSLFYPEPLRKIADMLSNPVFQETAVDEPIAPDRFDYAVEIGFRPGVTDNVGNTANAGITGLLGEKSSAAGVHTSQVMYLSGHLSKDDALRIGKSVANPLIQNIRVKSYEEFTNDNGMGVVVPRVTITEQPTVDLVSIVNASDEELLVIGKQGIPNRNGTRRGPLALDLTYMHAIQEHFRAEGREPTDIELESIAQTWSEHCKHTIFADPIDEIEDGLYQHFIKRATNEIRAARGEDDICVSVFEDNGGVIVFDDEHVVVDKAETHNSPSRLDGYGGAATGIGGVIRDIMGTGLGAWTFALNYNFCFADPEEQVALFRGADLSEPLEQTRKNFLDVIRGVRDYGNQSGIPTNQGTITFDEGYVGKPLVFVRAVGVMPKKSAGRPTHKKRAMPGNYIVMVGGRVGKDGIHGATFSSEAIDSGSPATAVQIGDPITQKRTNDALVREARDRKLYRSITDNGAGGLSCSVAEMGKESGGCRVDLEKVPPKYPGLAPWQTWISEAQERMTLAVPPENWDDLQRLMASRGVEATVIGEFTDSGRCVVDYEGENVMDLDMHFLHNGLPPRPMRTTFTRGMYEEPTIPEERNLTDSLHAMVRRQNIASFEFISQQYDHEVQGGSVVKPLQGRGRVNGDASVTRPVPDSQKGVVLTQGINPNYSQIDTYHMALCAIDTAVRNAVAAGATLDHLALLDNYCWCSPDEEERLGQLRRAAEGCYDGAVGFGTPFVSGKDSMHNDFKGHDENGRPKKISILPTLLISAIGVMEDARKAVTLDAKFPRDLVYVVGAHEKAALGGSEYYAMVGEAQRGKKFVGNDVPEVDIEANKQLYTALSTAIDRELVASAQSVHRGGLGVALAKTSMGGRLGIEVSLQAFNNENMRDDFSLYSESPGRVVLTVNPDYALEFEHVMEGTSVTRIGSVRKDDAFIIHGREGLPVVNTTVGGLLGSYRSTFEGY